MSARPGRTHRRPLPGSPSGKALVDRIVRVDHAGEYGARRIYEGQLAVLGGTAAEPVIRHMAGQEQRHLAAFERLIAERHVRPSLFHPLWHVAGFAVGAATALLGERAAMACTVAVEEVIDGHYAAQAARLPPEEAALRRTIEEFRGEELEHRDAALGAGAEEAPGYRAMTAAIKAGSRLAIWLAERF
jgi:ubiquinone biosynthesis monooxygenase Coq7